MGPFPQDWWRLVPDPSVDLLLPGIYEWRIADRAVYIGKSKRLPGRIREYPNNVRKLAAGLPYRKGKPTSYRAIHHELKRAWETRCPVTVTVLENCDLCDLNGRERYWILKRRTQFVGTGITVLNGP